MAEQGATAAPDTPSDQRWSRQLPYLLQDYAVTLLQSLTLHKPLTGKSPEKLSSRQQKTS